MPRGRSIVMLAAGALVVLGMAAGVRADLAGQFAGFDTVSEIGVSGLRSSYYVDSAGGTALPGAIWTLGDQRVWYPHVGQVPSPGGHVGRRFDQGVLGVKIEGGALTVKSATSVNPLTGRYYDGTVYGQGDVFLTVDDGAGVREYALLNSWARWCGQPVALNGGYFASAEDFHTGAGGGVNLEGHLVQLTEAADILLSGGRDAYDPGPTPEGLDFRVFATDGVDLGDANLTHSTTVDDGMLGPQTWYLQTWSIQLEQLSGPSRFMLGLHQSPSCANDQIGMLTEVASQPVPAPSAMLLGGLGLAAIAAGNRLRRRARRAA